MPEHLTSVGRIVDHCHLAADGAVCSCEVKDWTPAEKEEQWALLQLDFEQLIQEVKPTRKYNCHGFAYAGKHGWFCRARFFIEDDFYQVPFDEARVGDILVYRKSANGSARHSARVIEVVDGEITLCRSKWGSLGVVLHHPEYVPTEYYGDPWEVMRRNS
jgi:hypothetical protein